MPLQTSGAISLNQIHVEAGGGSGTQASINDADIRDLIGKGSGAQNSFSEYYGASAITEITATQTGGPNLFYVAPAVLKGGATAPASVGWGTNSFRYVPANAILSPALPIEAVKAIWEVPASVGTISSFSPHEGVINMNDGGGGQWSQTIVFQNAVTSVDPFDTISFPLKSNLVRLDTSWGTTAATSLGSHSFTPAQVGPLSGFRGADVSGGTKYTMSFLIPTGSSTGWENYVKSFSGSDGARSSNYTKWEFVYEPD